MKQFIFTSCLSTSLLSISSHSIASSETLQQHFFAKLKALCGQAFHGKVTEGAAQDDGFSNKVLTMHVRKCSKDTLEIPFHVGDNASRTWLVTLSSDGISLAHDHRHQDGSSDKVTMYGGKTKAMGTAVRQSFPIDQYSKTLFLNNNLAGSVDNTWHMEITESVFTYQLTRPNRVFTATFDLSQSVTPPPAPWGY